MNYYLKVLQNYSNFSGRARRAEYWNFVLINMILSFVAQLLDERLYFIYLLALFIPSLAVSIRRMHDVNKSGWFILIPIYNFILACTEGTKGDNDYGSDPKESQRAEV
jgi:uncharacterized membrane protein YhaH (DUF805 family)